MEIFDTILDQDQRIGQFLIGKNIIIEFQDKTGQIIRYDHDKLLNQLGNRITGLNCWAKYGHYSNSRELPKFIRDLNYIKHI